MVDRLPEFQGPKYAGSFRRGDFADFHQRFSLVPRRCAGKYPPAVLGGYTPDGYAATHGSKLGFGPEPPNPAGCGTATSATARGGTRPLKER